MGGQTITTSNEQYTPSFVFLPFFLLSAFGDITLQHGIFALEHICMHASHTWRFEWGLAGLTGCLSVFVWARYKAEAFDLGLVRGIPVLCSVGMRVVSFSLSFPFLSCFPGS